MPNTTQYIHSIESANVTYEFADNLVRLYIELHYDSTYSAAISVGLGLYHIAIPDTYLPELLKIVIDDTYEFEYVDGSSYYGNSYFVGLIICNNLGTLITDVTLSDSYSSFNYWIGYAGTNFKIRFVFKSLIETSNIQLDSNFSLTNVHYCIVCPIIINHLYDPAPLLNYLYHQQLEDDFYLGHSSDVTGFIGSHDSSEFERRSGHLGSFSSDRYTSFLIYKNSVAPEGLLSLRSCYSGTSIIYIVLPKTMWTSESRFRLINKTEESTLEIDGSVDNLVIYPDESNWLSPITVDTSGKISDSLIPSDIVNLISIDSVAPQIANDDDVYYNSNSHELHTYGHALWSLLGTTPSADKFYIYNNIIYRWNGTDLVAITSSASDLSNYQPKITTVAVSTNNTAGPNASFSNNTLTLYNILGAAGTNGDSAHITQLVTYDYTLYSYDYDGTTYTNVPTAPPEGSENIVETPQTEQATLPPAVEAAGTYVKHVRIKTWIGDNVASAVTSDDLYTGVALAQQISNAIQEILDGDVTTTSND